jgi:deoxyribodipyrimidine photolyase
LSSTTTTAKDNTNNDAGPPDLQNLPMTVRHGKFLLGGLQQVHEQLAKLNIPLHVIAANNNEVVAKSVCRLAFDKCNAIANCM